MSGYIPDMIITKVEQLKKQGKFDEALKLINHELMKNPTNEQALMQVVDIEYRRGELTKAEKPVDFLLKMKSDDPMALYIKGVLEMEKNNFLDAKKYFQEAIKLTKFENHEILRCYGLCEYWYGNREKGVQFLEEAWSLNNKDAEVIYNLIEIYLLEFDYRRAKRMIQYYQKNHAKLQTFDKEIGFYDQKVELFDRFIQKNA